MAFNRCACENPQVKFGTQQYKKTAGAAEGGDPGGDLPETWLNALTWKKGTLRNIRDIVTIDLVHPVPFLFLMLFWEAHFAPFDPSGIH